MREAGETQTNTRSVVEMDCFEFPHGGFPVFARLPVENSYTSARSHFSS